jgi:hypothetical protein
MNRLIHILSFASYWAALIVLAIFVVLAAVPLAIYGFIEERIVNRS